MSDRRPSSICAACGLPGHRYGRNEGMDRFDPMACINSLRAELDDPVAVVCRGVESGEIEGWVLIERDRIRYCPFCGRLVERENPDDEMCLPTNCEAWKFVSRFNHETREWEPVAGAGEVPK